MTRPATEPDDEGALADALVRGFGSALRSQRRKRGLSQEQLAQLASLNRSYLGEIERGSVIASLATVSKLAEALSLSPSELVSFGESSIKNEPCTDGN